MTRPFRLRRSELSTPGTSEKMMSRAAESGADLVFLDLEDSVAPGQKEGARRPVGEALASLDWGGRRGPFGSTGPIRRGATTTS